ncbi:MAG: glycerophosphodiester phosphodiesterase family protein [Spongiibacteraceae bacterium]
MNAEFLVAHRGWRHRFPENTLIAVKGALDAGARYIEIDVQVTADGEPVLFHDDTLDRLCRQRGAIADYKYAQLQQFSAYEPDRFGEQFLGTPITHLRDLVALFEQYPHAHLYLEIKDNPVIKFGNEITYNAVLPYIEKIRGRCTIISFVFDFLHYATTRGWSAVGPVLNRWEEIDSPALAALKPAVVFCDVHDIPAQRDLRAIPHPLVVYEVQDAHIANNLLQRGVQRVETFTVGELLETDA